MMRRRTFWLVGLAVASLALVGGCLSDDGGAGDGETSDVQAGTEEARSLHLTLGEEYGIARMAVEPLGAVNVTVEANYADTPSMDAILYIDSASSPPIIPVFDSEAPPPVTSGPAPADELAHEAIWTAEHGSRPPSTGCSPTG
jgi:hypothetical protein